MKIFYSAFIATILASDGHAAEPRVRKGTVLTSDAETIKGAEVREQVVVPDLKEVQKAGKSNGKSNGVSRGGNDRGGTCDDSASPGNSSGFSAVYGMTNEPNNEVIVYSRDTTTGLLTFEQAVSTTGAGGTFALNTGPPANMEFAPGIDPILTTDPLIVAGKCLLVSNPASHDVSTFRIKSASEIEFAVKVSSGGIWPGSIAHRDGLVYVLNAGGNGSIQGFRLNPGTCGLTSIAGPVGLNQGGGPVDPINASPSDPPSNLGSPSQVGFTPSGDVFVTIAINGGGQNLGVWPGGENGSLNIFHVEEDGSVSNQVQKVIDDRIRSLPASFDFDDQGRLLLSEITILGLGNPTGVDDPSCCGGVSVWDIDEFGEFELLEVLNVKQALTCWVKYNPRNGCAYTTNTGYGTISSVSSAGGDTATVVDSIAASGLPGVLDINVSTDGRHVYVLVPNVIAFQDGGLVPGTGQPAIHVYDAGCDCGLTEVQAITNGYPSQDERIAAAGGTVFQGVVGITSYPGPN